MFPLNIKVVAMKSKYSLFFLKKQQEGAHSTRNRDEKNGGDVGEGNIAHSIYKPM